MDERDRTRRDADEAEIERERKLGNPLGLAGSPVPATDDLTHGSDLEPGGIGAAEDSIRVLDEDESARRRARARALGDVETRGLGSDVNVDPDGAAGIDMGYGGEGTDIKPSR